MITYRPGLPPIYDGESPPKQGEVGAVPTALPSIEAAMELARARGSQVLPYTRKTEDPQPLIENAQPGSVVPHSINDKPEVQT
jgi:hypothetical protein